MHPSVLISLGQKTPCGSLYAPVLFSPTQTTGPILKNLPVSLGSRSLSLSSREGKKNLKLGNFWSTPVPVSRPFVLVGKFRGGLYTGSLPILTGEETTLTGRVSRSPTIKCSSLPRPMSGRQGRRPSTNSGRGPVRRG